MSTQDTEFSAVIPFGEGRVTVAYGSVAYSSLPCMVLDMDGKVHDMDDDGVPFDGTLSENAVLLTFTDVAAIRRIARYLRDFADDVEATSGRS